MFLMILLFGLMVVTQEGGMTKLPAPAFTNVSIEQCIAGRRSMRSFQDKALDLDQLSLLLWAAQGITDPEQGFRAAPSAGATYPLEVYLCTEEGAFHYVPQSHGIERIGTEDVRDGIAHAALDQAFIADAGCVLVIAAVYERTTFRYGERGVRYVHMEAGHAAQNIHLEAVALGLGSVPIGAFHDDMVMDILDLTDTQPVYIVAVGFKR